MFNLLKNLHNKSEQLPGRKILLLFLGLSIVFLLLGLAIGNIIKPKLNEHETLTGKEGTQNKENFLYYEGKIEYLNPGFYPDDGVSFSLVDGSGKQIILLKSKDQKLNIAEGLFVKVKGLATKTKDGKSAVLDVSEVIIKNATN